MTPMSTTSEIVERLLTAPGPLSTEDRRAAAARLSELERENARLRGALEPFTSQHAKWSERLPDTQRFALMCLSSPADGDIVMETDITMGDFRRAALAAQEKK